MAKKVAAPVNGPDSKAYFYSVGPEKQVTQVDTGDYDDDDKDRGLFDSRRERLKRVLHQPSSMIRTTSCLNRPMKLIILCPALLVLFQNRLLPQEMLTR